MKNQGSAVIPVFYHKLNLTETQINQTRDLNLCPLKDLTKLLKSGLSEQTDAQRPRHLSSMNAVNINSICFYDAGIMTYTNFRDPASTCIFPMLISNFKNFQSVHSAFI